MIKLSNSLEVLGTPEFEKTLREEIQRINPDLLPLQQGLSQSSYVSNSAFSVMILNVTEMENDIVVKTGIHYSGVIAGCNCADDPTPMDELTEYCEVLFNINKTTAETTVALCTIDLQ